MQELDSDEKEFVKRYDENIENYKRLLNKKNELNSEISCYQSLISELEKIIQEDEDKKINLLAMEDIKKKLCSFENELEIIEKQISDSEEFRKTNADKYDELSYILIYGNRWSYVKNSMRKNEF